MTSRIERIRSRLPSLSYELENKGSVARDHLAGERTFLAWLRTSLALVSLGVAIAQLFKLPELVEADDGDDENQVLKSFLQQQQQQQQVSTQSAIYQDADQQNQLHFLQQIFDDKSPTQFASLQKLGKPLGATCIGLGAICLLLGSYRYYTVQKTLIRGQFPPSRIEISFMALLTGAFIIAAFGIIVGAQLNG